MNKNQLPTMTKTFLALTFAAAMAVSLRAAPMGTAFTYQGKLQDGGAPATGLYDFNFKLFTGPSNADPQVGSTITTNKVPVTNGLFMVKLDFGNQFPGDARWLEIWANTNNQSVVKLDPRQELTPQPYAIFAGTAATVTNQAITTVQLAPGAVTAPQIGSLAPPAPGQVLTYSPAGLFWTTPSSLAWLLNGNGGTTSSNFLGTTDFQSLDVRVNNSRALRLEPTGLSPNIIGGHPANGVAPGYYGATISGGGEIGAGNRISAIYATIGGGFGNTNVAPYGTISGGRLNQVTNLAATVAGGQGNSAANNWASVGGGNGNLAGGQDSVVAGGSGNAATAGQSVVGGGIANQANGSVSTVGGGSQNVASGQDSVVSGGSANLAASGQSTVGGGLRNTAIGTASTIGGGYYNSNFTAYGTIGGGALNSAIGSVSTTIAGGYQNFIYGQDATIGGGSYNTAQANFSIIAGGQYNAITTNADASVVGGGRNNRIESIDYGPGIGIAYATGSVIAGGEQNVVSGATDAVIIGGVNNTNSGVASAVLAGEKNVVVFDHSVVSGNGALSRTSYSVTHGAMFSTPGDGQIAQYLLKGTTVGTTTFDLAGPIPPVGSGIGFTAIISAKAFGDFSGAFEVKGVIRNYGGGVAFVAAPSVTVLGRDNASLSVAAVVASGGRLGFRVTGISGLNVRWVCSLRTAEVQF